MKASIGEFLATKRLSENSRAAYGYDLEQFCHVVADQLSPGKLERYSNFLEGLAPSASKRKLSAVNQFLYYLYQVGAVPNFYKLTPRQAPAPVERPQSGLLDLSVFWEPTPHTTGQLMALLMWQLGLTPSELLAIRQKDLDRNFQVLTVIKSDLVRVLPLSERLFSYFGETTETTYLFDRKGRPFTRQWAFQQLRTYLESIGLSHLTAQKLREQYVLSQVQQGVTAWDLAKKLGLKTTTTLMTYYK